MYKLGIIGGMGPLATARFYEKIVLNTKANNDNEHIDTVILSHASIPDRTECIINGNKEIFLEEIKKDFQIMNSLDVKKIVIPCNTSHFFFDEYKKYTDINIVNMVEETVKRIHDMGLRKAYVFGTLGTVNSHIYEKYGKNYNVDILQIDKLDQKQVMEIIYNIKKDSCICDDKFNQIVDKYVRKDCIGIIACTELSLINIVNKNIIDAFDILVEEACKI